MTTQTLRTALTSLLAVSLLVACSSTPSIASTQRINSSADAQWTKILEAIPQSTNVALTTRVRNVSSAILIGADENPAEWQVALFDKPDVANAFALPNKRIGIFTGILTHTANDDQLAAVIGHEIAHVRLEHTKERINRGILPGVISGVARLPGTITNVGVLESAGEITSGVVKAGTVLPFDRAQELNADLEGLTYLANAGFAPEQAAAFWRNMASDSASSIEVLSTHPSNERRIRALERAAQDLKSN